MTKLLPIRYDIEKLLLKFARLSIFLFFAAISFLMNSHTVLAQENSSNEDQSNEKTTANKEGSFAFDRRLNMENEVKDKLFVLTMHRPNYFLGATYNENPNEGPYEEAGRDLPNTTEAKFQLSFKMLIWQNIFNGHGDLYAAYTQLSMWQIYDFSSPFRETNYEPELFLKFDTDLNFAGFRNRLFLIGLVHQSNGQDVPLSRSWNRVYVEFIATRGDFVLGLKPWYRFPESENADDNPDIEDYLGYGKLWGAYKMGDHVFSFTLHNNLQLNGNKGSIELGWSYAIIKNLRVYLQYYNGYGESMIDYNNFAHRIGLGLMINDWL